METNIIIRFIIWVFFMYGALDMLKRIFYGDRAGKDELIYKGKIGLIVYEQGTNIAGIKRILEYHGIEIKEIEIRELEEIQEVAHSDGWSE